MELLSVTVRCGCGVETTVPWSEFDRTLWTDVTTCECCGNSVVVRADVTCSGCGQTQEVVVHGA